VGKKAIDMAKSEGIRNILQMPRQELQGASIVVSAGYIAGNDHFYNQ
jgi:hypothetical protein